MHFGVFREIRYRGAYDDELANKEAIRNIQVRAEAS
jgi:hypothetical protein